MPTLLTQFDTIPGVPPAREGEIYVWEIPAFFNSLEKSEGQTPAIEGQPAGMWATPEEAYADVQAYLLANPMPVLPSCAQIMRTHPILGGAEVTHVVWLG